MAVTVPSVYWKLDEASGNRSDSVGSQTLTDNNTVTSTTGLISTAAQFTRANSEYLSNGTNLGASPADVSMSFQFWIKPSSNPSSGQFYQIMSYTIETSNSGWQYFVDYTNSGGTYQLRFIRGGSEITYNLAGALSTSTWTHIVGTYNGSQIELYVNGSSVATAAASGVGNVGSAPNYFRLGQYLDGNGGILSRYFDGLMDEVGVWFSYKLTSSEVTELYNSGAGKSYPYSTAYTMTASTGTFTLTGVANVLNIALRMTAALGTFALTGIDTALKYGRGFVADVATFVLTGIDASVTSARRMTADVGTFALTGIAATFNKALNLVAEVGSFVLTGITTILRKTGWSSQGKSNATWANGSKNSANWQNQDKSD